MTSSAPTSMVERPVTGEQGFAVQAQALNTHAGTIEQVADAVRQGRSAAASVQMGREAYGRLCQLIPSLLDPVQDAAVSTLADAVEALHRSADDLRTIAGRYTTGDERVADLFGGDGTRR